MFVQGEMSATIMRFASDWSKLVDPMRGRILGKSSNVTVKIGVGLNFNRLDDTSSVTKEWGSSRLSWLAWQVGIDPPAGSREGVPQIDEDALHDLFNNKLDFLGVSAYAAYRINGGSIDLDEYENSAFMLCNEMKDSYNIDIKGMANSGKLELQYSEFGIGGGTGYAGGQVGGIWGAVLCKTKTFCIWKSQTHSPALVWSACYTQPGLRPARLAAQLTSNDCLFVNLI
jgi:hypothetical protein